MLYKLNHTMQHMAEIINNVTDIQSNNGIERMFNLP